MVRKRDPTWWIDKVRKKLYLQLDVVDGSEWMKLTGPLVDKLDPKDAEDWKARMAAHGIRISARECAHLQQGAITMEQFRKANQRSLSARAFRT
jgi:hypothetical protein